VKDEATRIRKIRRLELAFDFGHYSWAVSWIIVDQENGSSLKERKGFSYWMETNDKFIMYGAFVVVTDSYRYRLVGLID